MRRFGRMILRPLLLAALLVPLVGCALAATPSSPAPMTSLPWDTIDCNFTYATAEIPVARLAGHVPAGFRPYADGQSVTENQVADLVFEADSCAHGSGLNGEIAPMSYASTWIPARPPPKYVVPSTPFIVVAQDILIPDADRRAAITAAGTSAFGGGVTYSVDLHNGLPMLPFAVDTTLEGYGAIHFDITPIREITPPGSGTFGQYSGSRDPLTYWETPWAAKHSYQGVGVVTVPEGSWQAQVFGSARIPVRVNFGIWDYAGGKIVIPG